MDLMSMCHLETTRDMNEILGYLNNDEKLAVMQVGYQLIEGAANATGRRICEQDEASVDIIIESVTMPSGNAFLDKCIYNQMWNEAIWMNPYEAFAIVKKFDKEEKAAFKEMMLNVARKDMVALRMDILKQTFEKVDIYEYE